MTAYVVKYISPSDRFFKFNLSWVFLQIGRMDPIGIFRCFPQLRMQFSKSYIHRFIKVSGYSFSIKTESRQLDIAFINACITF